MSTDNQPDSIHVVLPRVMKDLGAVSKDRTNKQQGYAFRSYEDLYKAVQPLLVIHGVLAVPHRVKLLNSSSFTTKSGGTGYRILIRQTTRFYGPKGDWLDVQTIGEGIDYSDKGSGKAMSTAHKYAFFQALCVPCEEMIDVEADNPVVHKEPAQRSTEPPVNRKAKEENGFQAAAGKIVRVQEEFDKLKLEIPTADLNAQEPRAGLRERCQKIPHGEMRDELLSLWGAREKELNGA